MKKQIALKPTILSISLLTIMASAAVSPALAKIAQAFPESEITIVKMILTLPSLLIIPFSLLTGWLASRMSKKRILMVGLLIYAIAGVGGGFAKSMTQLLIIRGILGIGIGLIMPLSTTLIADFFEGKQRTKMMGLSGSVNNLGGVVFLSVSGWLATISWRYSFGVYALAIVTLLMVMLWLPEPPKAEKKKGEKIKLGGGIAWLAFLSVLMMIAFYAVPTNLALFIESEKPLYASQVPIFENVEELNKSLESGQLSQFAIDNLAENGIDIGSNAVITKGEEPKTWIIDGEKRKYIVRREEDGLIIYAERLGRPAIAGYALSSMTLSGVVSGLILSTVMTVLGIFAIPIAIFLMGLGFFILANASALWMVFVAVPCIGISAGILMPNLMLAVPRIVKKNARTLAMAIVGSAVFFGQFLSPIALKAITTIFHNESYQFRFSALAYGLFFAGIVGLIISIIKKKNTPEVS